MGDDEDVFDILGGWEEHSSVYSKHRLVFRYRLFDGLARKKNEKEEYLWAIECSFQLAIGCFPMADGDAWELASILCQVIHGNQKNKEAFFRNGCLQF